MKKARGAVLRAATRDLKREKQIHSKSADIHMIDGGSLVGFQAISRRAKDWIETNITADPWKHTVWAERSHANALREKLVAAGLTVK